MNIADRIRDRLNDAPIPTERLLDEAADRIDELEHALRSIVLYPGPPPNGWTDADVDKIRGVAMAVLAGAQEK